MWAILLASGATLLTCTSPKTAPSQPADAGSSTSDASSLFPEGPPMVLQVLMSERITLDNGAFFIERGRLAFGNHSAPFFDDDDGIVENAVVRVRQEIRIVLDEHIRENTLIGVTCANGALGRIPDDATPSDIADCSGPVSSLVNCTKVCIADDGSPIGIVDVDDDGIPDEYMMLDYDDDPLITELGVALYCDDTVIPLDPRDSYWSSAGSQNINPNLTTGFLDLGPVLVISSPNNIGLRTGATCTIRFRPEIVDHDGNQICAPVDGRIENGCVGGDTTAISFKTEVLTLARTRPVDGALGVAISESKVIVLELNANIDESSLSGITLTAGTTLVTIQPTVQIDSLHKIHVRLDNDFLPSTTYTLTVPSDLADVHGSQLGQAVSIRWTTE